MSFFLTLLWATVALRKEYWGSEAHLFGNEQNLQSRPDFITKVDYGGLHPWESPIEDDQSNKRKQKYRRESNLSVYDYKRDNPTQPIRIFFYTDFVSSILHFTDKENFDNLTDTYVLDGEEEENVQIQVLINEILPQSAEFWSKAIGVIPVQGNLRINAPAKEGDFQSPKAQTVYSNCPMVEEHSETGVPDTDIIIYLYATTKCANLSETESVVGRSSITGYTLGIPCELDQFDRPIGGILDFCLDSLETNRKGIVPDYIKKNALTSVARQIGNILGVHPALYRFFRHPKTGKPLTPRPFIEEQVQCVDGSTSTLQMPACNTLKMGQTANGVKFYQVVTPTVSTIMQNHFGCSYVEGARLENQHYDNRGVNCYGSEWESRWFEGELMAPMHTSSTHQLSPLTLALLEDSGWYVANYSASKTLSFGHLAGCRFLHDDCIGRGDTVPEYMDGFICNRTLSLTEFELSTAPRSCDPYNTHKSFCDLVDFDDPFFGNIISKPSEKYSHFSNSSWGALNIERDYCPSALPDESINCLDADRSSVVALDIEVYGDDSRCFNRVSADPICLDSICDETTLTLRVFIDNHTYVCSNDVQTIELPNGEGSFVCPKLSQACPDFYCHKSCRGRGKCILKTNSCECFNKSDSSVDCQYTDIVGPIMSLQACGDVQRSSATVSCSFVALTIMLLASLVSSLTI